MRTYSLKVLRQNEQDFQNDNENGHFFETAETVIICYFFAINTWLKPGANWIMNGLQPL